MKREIPVLGNSAWKIINDLCAALSDEHIVLAKRAFKKRRSEYSDLIRAMLTIETYLITAVENNYFSEAESLLAQVREVTALLKTDEFFTYQIYTKSQSTLMFQLEKRRKALGSLSESIIPVPKKERGLAA